ncbi:hypothetical protein [Paenibacillus apis]|uniref:Uncharacterized protein n=1 Tax=Paenibacillus apis TaxID=1792174 RepID=A0A920CMA7_9BACL|nr:hypothetical protein [Paenibacillus apis]GIO42504.1 hypothetical protein J41TS4_22620 [Paenibacillus apis]
MKYGLSNEEAIQAIKSNYPPESYTMLREALDMAMNALQQLTEKDATIKKLKDMSQRWEKAFTNADKQYLKKEKEVAELRKMIEWRDERFKNANEQCDRLRKALEEAYTTMTDALQVMEMEKRDFNLMPQCTIKDAAEELEKILYPVGEGDKE